MLGEALVYSPEGLLLPFGLAVDRGKVGVGEGVLRAIFCVAVEEGEVYPLCNVSVAEK